MDKTLEALKNVNDKVIEDDKLMKILEKQLYPDEDILSKVEVIWNDKFNKEQRVMGSMLPTLMDYFNYGVMTGKRKERKKFVKMRSENVKLKFTLAKIMQYVKNII